MSGKLQARIAGSTGFYLLTALAFHLAELDKVRDVVLIMSSVLAGAPIAFKAFQAARAKAFSIDLLVTIAVVGALIIGEYVGAAVLSFLSIFGAYLKARTLEKSRSSLRDLAVSQPEEHQVSAGPVRSMLWWCAGIAVLSGIAAAAGLWPREGPGRFWVETVRGQAAEITGDSLYRYDTVFTAAGSRATDFVTLVIGIPLLLVGAVGWRRGSTRAGLVLLGTLGYFLYVYAGYALGAIAYNELFLLYVVLFSAALYAFVLVFAAFSAQDPARLFLPGTPRRGPAVLMFASTMVLVVVWGIPLVSAALTGATPAGLGPYSTEFTEALDLAVIAPATVWAGVLILRQDPRGYLIAVSLLVLEVLLAPLIIAQTVLQLRAGVIFTLPEIIGPILGFVVLAVASIAVLVVILRPTCAATSTAAGNSTERKPR